MNNIYKVIWSKAKNCYVVASEIARSHTKSATGSGKIGGVTRRSLLASLMALSLLCGGLGVAEAAVVHVNEVAGGTSAVYTTDETYTKTEADAKLDLKANAADVNTELAKKADAANVYTKNEADAKLDLKANAADVNTELAKKADKTYVDTEVGKKADKATTLAGYGITDAYTKAEVNTAVANAVTTAGNNVDTKLADYAKTTYVDTEVGKKADKATTLAGYGITDAYTKSQVSAKLNDKADKTDLTQAQTAIDGLNAKTTKITYDAALGTSVDGVTFNAGTVTGVTSINGTIIGTKEGGKYISQDGSIWGNMKKVDTQVETNAKNITKNKDDITALDTKVGTVGVGTYLDSTKSVGENLGRLNAGLEKEVGDRTAAVDAEKAAREAEDTNLSNRIGTVTEDGTYIKKSATNNVSENLKVLDTQTKTNADAIAQEIADRKAAIGELAVDGNYIEKAKNVSDNLVKLDNQAKANADEIVKTNERTGGIKRNTEGTQTTIEGKVTVNNSGDVGGVKGLSAETINTTGNATIGGDLKVTGTITTDKMVFGDKATNNYTEIDHGKVTSKNLVVNGAGETISSSSTFNAKENKVGFANSATGDQSFHKQTSDVIMDNVKDLHNSNNRTQTKTETKDIITDKDGNSSTTSQTASENKTYLKDKDGKNTNSTIDTAKGYDKTIKGENGETSTKQDELNITNTAQKGTIKNDAMNIENNATGDMTNTVGGKLTTTVTGQATENFNGGLDTNVTGKENHTVTGDQNIHVTGKQTNEIGGDQENTIGGNQTTTVEGNVKEDYKKDLTTTVGGNELHEVTGTKTENVTGKVTENYKAGQETNVTGDQVNIIGGNQTTTVTGDISNKAENITNEANTKLTDKVDDNTRVLDSEGITDTVPGADGKGSTFKQRIDAIMGNVKTDAGESEVTQKGDEITSKVGLGEATNSRVTQKKDLLEAAVTDGTNYNISNDTANESAKELRGGTKVNRQYDNLNGSQKTITNGTYTTSKLQTALDITNTAEYGTITNDAKNIVNNATGDMTNTVGGKLTTTVTGQATENFKGGLKTDITGEEIHTVTGNQTNKVTGKQTNTVEGGQENIISGGQINNITDDQTTTISGTQTTTATDIKRNASSGMIDTIDNDYGTNTETKVAGKTTTDVSIKGTGEKGQYIRGANESRDYLIKGTLKNSETKTVEKTSTEITDGTNKASTIQDAKNLAGSVTNGTETGVSGIHANDDGSVSIDSGVTDGTNTSVQKQTASAIATDVKDGAGNENASVATATTSANTIKSGSKANTVISTADGTSFINSEAAAPVTGASGAGTAVNTTIKGNTITTGKVTMDYAEVMKDLGVRGNANITGKTTTGSLEVTGTSTLKGDVTMESNATVNGNFSVGGNTNLKNTEVDGTLNVTQKATFGDSVSIAKDLSVGGDVTANSYKVGDKTYIDANGINANDQKITNVADGSISEGSKDAVNGGQLYGVKRDLEHQVDKVGANAAAMANLRPMEFDPSSKWNIAAAIGNYGSETAAALGAFYRPNDDVMVNLSTAFGTGENMVGGGVSVRLGKGGNKLSREENNALKDQVADLTARMDALLSVLNPNMSKDFPDVPENHWAYEAVSRLAGNDIVQGYPDGEFHGERTMTRYEMAEIIYNALSRGAEAERELVEEFKPELQAMAASEKATAEKAEG